MSKNRNKSRWFVMGLTAIIVIGIAAVTLSYSQEGSTASQMTAESTKMEMTAASDPNMEKEAGETKEKEMMEHKEAMHNADMHKTHMEQLNMALASVDMALKAIDSGDTKAAKADLDKAKMSLVSLKESMEKHTKMMKTCNTKCPMTGISIDPVNVPENQTCMYKGKKVGFCTAGCVAAWGKLSDAEKDAKLQNVVPAVNARCPISGKAIDRMNIPEDQSRMYKGMKIGFCCTNCPGVWDKLSDAEKDAKLEKVMPPAGQKKMMKMEQPDTRQKQQSY